MNHSNQIQVNIIHFFSSANPAEVVTFTSTNTTLRG